MCLIEVTNLRADVLDARAAAQTRVDLERRDQRVIAEHVAERERESAAERRAEAADADADNGLRDAFDPEAWRCTARPPASTARAGRRVGDASSCDTSLDLRSGGGRTAAFSLTGTGGWPRDPSTVKMSYLPS